MDNNLPPQETPGQSITDAPPEQPLSSQQSPPQMPPPPPSNAPLSAANVAQPPVPPTETPPSQSNKASNADDATVPRSADMNVAVPQSNAAAVQNAVKATLPPQNIEQPSQYQPQTSPLNQAGHQAQALVQPQPEPTDYQDTGFTQKEVKPFTWRAFAKMAYIIIFIIGSLGGVFFVSNKTILKPEARIAGNTLLQAPYQPVLWKDFGEVFEPIIEIPLYYPPEGFVKHKFLLDSGALVSSLPREEAKKMGLSLAKLPRSTFGGFGGTTSFAYKSEVKIKLGEEEVKIPVVFTETEGTKSILGRSGFFEKYSIYFNSKREMIEIRK